jgi:hypothetical protein
MNWDTKRKVLYAFFVVIVLSILTIFFLHSKLFPDPTCFDKKQNGYESGVDCGGVCRLRCENEVYPLTVLWSTAVKSSSSHYDLVGLVSNKNINNASLGLGYLFTVYSASGDVLTTISGTTTAPLDGNFPIILQDVPLSETPERVTLSLVDSPHYLVKENPVSPTVTVSNRVYEPGIKPRVYALIKNNKQFEVRDLEVRVLLFDENNNVFAVGRTIIPLLVREQAQKIVFTWNTVFEKPPTRILVYPIFNPFQVQE